jgi:hypothetical protein
LPTGAEPRDDVRNHGIVFVVVLVAAGVEALRRTSLARKAAEQQDRDAGTGTSTAALSAS